MSEKEIENGGGDGNVGMDVDGFGVVMAKSEGGEKVVEEGSQLMEVDNGVGVVFDKGGLEGNVVKEADVGDGVDAKNCVDVQSESVEDGKDGREVPRDCHMEESKRGDELETTNNGALGMGVSLTDGGDKKVSSNELSPKSLLAKGSGGFEKTESDGHCETDVRTPSRSFLGDPNVDGYESGTEEEQTAFLHEIEVFFRERGMDFKPPKFYQEQLNLLKLWRWVIKLGGYEQVSSNKLWRQVGESFKPPKTCTTISWSFRGFYEKALLEYEKQKISTGELPEIDASLTGSMSPAMQGTLSLPTQPTQVQPTQPTQPSSIETQGALSQPPGIGRIRRDAAARAMQGWHSLRASNNDELGDPIIKDKSLTGLGKREKQLNNSLSVLKRPKQSPVDHVAKVGHMTPPNSEHKTTVVDVGPPSDWMKINVQRTKDCFEVYILVPGLSREEVRVQSDPAGRLVISGQPEQSDNPWGVTPFKKVVTLPSRIDPHQTSAVVTLHGQLFVRAPFEQSDS